VHVGAGSLFEELYRTLAPHNLNIVGGSGLAGVGVTGWMLGGGYSTKTSQYGLGVDNIAAARLILPNGDLKVVTAANEPELFYAIKV
jgi:FAD/FMN-containing dehydrogenase